ncbi:hypothetical protein ACFWPH_34380 [Nocardia sp. NPDC058499]|uniref:hypothetical protein n=1 Tax=Nocardia sp. NPDC058499 TaxID=3346530 RepID=UPI00364973DE
MINIRSQADARKATHDLAALRAVLTWASDLPQLVTALPLAIQWLTIDYEALITEFAAAGKPVAPMLESEGDPVAMEAGGACSSPMCGGRSLCYW